MPDSWTPVVDGVDDVMASHINTLYDEVKFGTLRGWYSNTETLTGTKTLVDSDLPLQFLDPGGAARDVFLPAESEDNHTFVIINRADAAEAITVKNDSSDTIATVTQDEKKQFASNGIAWVVIAEGGIETTKAATSDIDAGTNDLLYITPAGFLASTRNVSYPVMRFIDAAADWSADGTTDVGGAVPLPFTGTIISIKADVDVAGTSDTAIVDANLNGATIMSTHKLKWDSGEKSTATYSGTPATLTTTAVTAGDLFTIDVDTNHTSVKSKGLTVTLGIRKA